MAQNFIENAYDITMYEKVPDCRAIYSPCVPDVPWVIYEKWCEERSVAPWPLDAIWKMCMETLMKYPPVRPKKASGQTPSHCLWKTAVDVNDVDDASWYYVHNVLEAARRGDALIYQDLIYFDGNGETQGRDQKLWLDYAMYTYCFNVGVIARKKIAPKKRKRPEAIGASFASRSPRAKREKSSD